MVASFLIFLGAALEASMVYSTMLTYLSQIGRRDRFRAVRIGVLAAIAVDVIGGIAVVSILRSFVGTMLQTKIEGTTYFIACGVLIYMTFWIKKQGRNLKEELHAKINTAVSMGSVLAIALIAFVTVGREALETIVFLTATAFNTSPVLLAIGAVAGVFAGLILSYVIYVLGKRIILKHFFNVMGTFIMLFAAGLFIYGIRDFQQLGWLPREPALRSTTSILGEDSSLAIFYIPFSTLH